MSYLLFAVSPKIKFLTIEKHVLYRKKKGYKKDSDLVWHFMTKYDRHKQQYMSSWSLLTYPQFFVLSSKHDLLNVMFWRKI